MHSTLVSVSIAWAKRRKCFHNELYSVCNIVRINFKHSFTCDSCNVRDVSKLTIGVTTGYLAGAWKKLHV